MENMEENTGPISVSKLKDYGKKAYAPLVDVVFKYQDEFTPYIGALRKGLQGGVESLSGEDASDKEKYVARFFQEAADGLNGVFEKLESKDVKALASYFSDLAEKRPAVMFSTSYIAGLFFGRLGRHILNTRNKTTQIEQEPIGPTSDIAIH